MSIEVLGWLAGIGRAGDAGTSRKCWKGWFSGSSGLRFACPVRSAARPGRFGGFQVLQHPKKRPGPPRGRLWVRGLPGFGGLDALVQLRGQGLGDLVCGHLGFQIVSQAGAAGLVAVGGGQPDLGEN